MHRIGTISEWTTVSQAKESERLQIAFTLTSDHRTNLKVTEQKVSLDTPLGTTIAIFNIRDKGRERLTPAVVANDLLSHYCSFLLGNPSRSIYVQDEPLNVEEMIQNRESEVIPPLPLVPQEAILTHLLLHRPVDQSRFPAQILFSAKGRTVANMTFESIPSSTYLGIIECPYLDSMVTSNRELLIEIDAGFTPTTSLLCVGQICPCRIAVLRL